eukprot:1160382-Pelagomonas_calceolata.AAC.20
MSHTAKERAPSADPAFTPSFTQLTPPFHPYWPISCPPLKISIWRPLMLVVPLLTTLPPFRLVSKVNTVKTLGMDLPANARAQLRNKNPDTHSKT